MPLNVNSQAEEGERKVQNIRDDNVGVYLEAATKDSSFVRENKISIMLQMYRLWDLCA
jgi:hypothetical protein